MEADEEDEVNSVMNRIRFRNFPVIMLVPLAVVLIAAILVMISFGTNSSSAPSQAKFTHAAFTPSWEALELNQTPARGTHSEQTVAYRIQVQLNEQDHTLTGRQWITWRNPGEEEVKVVYLHLYPNAFQSKKTTFMKESGGKLREDHMREDSFGQMKIISMQAGDGKSLMSADYVRPDDGNKYDHTLMKIVLDEPVQPREQLKLHIEFHVKLPYVFARMGYAEDFVMAGQWFPKLAAFETAGTRGRKLDGWNRHQYHGNSEFYANFGRYDVEINVPADYEVAATGSLADQNTLSFSSDNMIIETSALDLFESLTNKAANESSADAVQVQPRSTAEIGKEVFYGNEKANQRKTVRFIAEDVHDFAWSASPHFHRVETVYSDPNVSNVAVKLYLQPEHEALANRYLRAAVSSIKHYSEWFGTYPYSTLSVVVPPAGASGAGGMEYPTLVTAWAADKKEPGYELEQVILHEIAHQYFYGLVASNEFEEAWLDEAFTSYAEDKLMKKEYGLITPVPIEAAYITSPRPLTMNAWDYASHDEYAENVYIRGKLVLKAIEQQLGSDLMMQVLRKYVDEWRFGHPSTADFVNILEKVSKREWKNFIEQYVLDGMMVDYAIEKIVSKMTEQEGKAVFTNEIAISRHGGFGFEVPILLKFEDGHEVHTSWDGKEPNKRFRVAYSSPLAWVAIDPDHTVILENRRINNFMRAEIDGKAKDRLSLGAARIAEIILNMFVW